MKIGAVIVLASVVPLAAHAGQESACSKELPRYAAKVWEARQAGATREQALARADKMDSPRPPVSDRRYIVMFAYEFPADFTTREFVMYWQGFCQGKADAAVHPVMSDVQPPAKVWTEAELKALKGRPVEYFVEVLGKPWYEAESTTANGHFLNWDVSVRSELTHEIIKSTVNVTFGARRTAMEVTVYGGPVK